MINREWHLLSRPVGWPKPEDFALVEAEVPTPGEGQVLVRNAYLSVDPYMRGRMSAAKSYVAPFELGKAMQGGAVGEVVASNAEGFEPGDTVAHALGWREYATVPVGGPGLAGAGALERLDVDAAPPNAYLGPLGYMGLTAYVGLLYVAALKAGDIVWVSAAAGAVGSLAAQIAKLRGHYVVGSAGSPAKVAYLLDDLGLDAAFDYHTSDLHGRLHEAAPQGIDVYFDNVGGGHLEAALGVLRNGGRVALSGAISEYDASSPEPGPANMFQIVAKSLTLRGFRSGAYNAHMDEMRRELGGWLAQGQLHLRETIVDGLANAPEALVMVMTGANYGKTLVRLP
jgi:NADPH-dependent curcumin reductase CurA